MEIETATLLVSFASLLISCTTLVVVVVGGKRVKFEVETVKMGAAQKIEQLKRAVAEL